MDIEPLACESNEFFDIFQNANVHLLVREPHKSLVVIGRSKVEIFPEIKAAEIENIRTNSITYGEAKTRLSKFHKDDVQAKKFLFESELISHSSLAIKEYALESFQDNRDVFEATYEFMSRIFSDFEFLFGFSDVTTPVEIIFEAKKGVCQDFAQLAIAGLRSIGLPAKYISGYIETLPPEGEEKLFGVDASHAWFAVYIPNAGWAHFDPTNNMIPNEQHIILGSGRDYGDISPLKGVVVSSGNSHVSVMVDVRREEVLMRVQSQSQSL